MAPHFPVSLKTNPSLLFVLIPLICLRIQIKLIDPYRRELLNVQTFTTIITDLIWIEVTDFAFQAPVTLFFLVQYTHFPFHVNEYSAYQEKKQLFFEKSCKMYKTNVCNS